MGIHVMRMDEDCRKENDVNRRGRSEIGGGTV